MLHKRNAIDGCGKSSTISRCDSRDHVRGERRPWTARPTFCEPANNSMPPLRSRSDGRWRWRPLPICCAAIMRFSWRKRTGAPNGPFIASARVRSVQPRTLVLGRWGAHRWRRCSTSLPVGVATRTEFIADADFARTAAYNDLIRPMNGFHGMHLRQTGAVSVFFNVCRPPRADNFDSDGYRGVASTRAASGDGARVAGPLAGRRRMATPDSRACSTDWRAASS